MAAAITAEEPERPSAAVTRGRVRAGEAETDGDAEALSTLSSTREGTPERLSRRLRDDLDTIILTALRKEPGRRYQSVDAFSEDIRRHLEGLPVKARRARRRMSQLDLACEADISTRHLSFVETGRAQPSRDMLLHLAERLEVPLRERNTLLVAAGYAPVFPERDLTDPALSAARKAVDVWVAILAGHATRCALSVVRFRQGKWRNIAVGIEPEVKSAS